MFTSLLVPLDRSSVGEHTLPYAEAIASLDGSALHLAHVHVPHLPTNLLANTSFHWEGVNMDYYDDRQRAEEREYLDRLVGRVRLECDAEVAPVLLDGEVVAALETHARAVHAGMILISAHGESGTGHLWLGHVAETLVRHGTLPIFLVPADGGGPLDADEVCLDHVVIPLDGTEWAERALEPAMDLGAVAGSRFTLVHVVAPRTVLGRPYLPFPSARTQRRHETAARYMDGVAERFRVRDLPVCVRVVEGVDPGREILRTAVEEDADLVALAFHDHGRLFRRVLGSVGETVGRGSTRPLLLLGPGVAQA